MDYKYYKNLCEVSEIEEVVEVLHAQTSKSYRIEVVRFVVGTASIHYAVNYYVKNKARIWEQYLNFPAIHSPTPEGALHQALSYVSDRPQLADVEPA